ncbi:hypothetical protein BB381_07770 [Campylobacter pinnipediorum subsp. caledonicus]|nr:hypothetical protein BB381_07770 [Campylobacter pinnipediorum subsp. caledonicus]
MVRLSELFDIKYGNSLELINLEQCKSTDRGATPFISRTEKNNGVSAFVYEMFDIKPNTAHTLSVAVGGSVLATFYQPQPYYTGYHIMVLSPKKEMSVIQMLFYSKCIYANKYRYNYGRQANKTLKDLLIPKDIPHQLLTKMSNYKNNLQAKMLSKPVSNEKLSLNTDSWKEFYIKDLFDITGSKTTSMIELEEYGIGKYPYVTTQASNNGIEGFYDFSTEDGNVLSIDSAVLGYCSYQPFDFSASDHVEKLIPKFKMNKYIAMFLVTILNLEQYRYNYGRKASQTRIKKMKIKLPAKNGEVDFEFMENYIKSLNYSQTL